MTLFKGPDQIELYYFGRGHTNGDAWVLFPTLRVVTAGDIVSGKNLPLLDANNGGSGLEIGDTIAQGAQHVQQDRRHRRDRSQRQHDHARAAWNTRRSIASSRQRCGRRRRPGRRRRSREELDDAREVPGLCRSGRSAAAVERAGHLRRNQIAAPPGIRDWGLGKSRNSSCGFRLFTVQLIDC